VALGPRDWAPAFADSATKAKGKNVLFSSLHESKTQLRLPPTKIIERPGFKLGVISLVSATINRLENGPAYDVESFLREQLAALKNKNADIYAVVFLGSAPEVMELNRKFPEVDLWLQANGNHRPLQLLTSANDALVVGAGDRGRELGFITIEKEKKGDRLASSFHQIILTDRIVDAPKGQVIIQNFRNAARAAQSPPKPANTGNGVNQ
jgi:hypothetical protein